MDVSQAFERIRDRERELGQLRQANGLVTSRKRLFEISSLGKRSHQVAAREDRRKAGLAEALVDSLALETVDIPAQRFVRLVIAAGIYIRQAEEEMGHDSQREVGAFIGDRHGAEAGCLCFAGLGGV